MKFCFFSLGCKVNRFESEALSQIAQNRGHTIVYENADVCILNSCTVTSTGDSKNIRAIKNLKKSNPHAIIAVYGCMAQIEPEKLKQSGLVDIIHGTSERSEIISICENYIVNNKFDYNFKPCSNKFEMLPASIPLGRTRALLKIQDGCDNYCTYCIIPYARGHVRSLPINEAINQAIKLQENGAKEIVLTGIEISSYGRDLENKPNLINLIEKICSAVPNTRIRLSSLEPRMADINFCEKLKDYKNLMPHFHLSLQSGCDSVLSRMKRKYTTDTFYKNVQLLRKYFKNCSITTDIIVGFPNETEDEFNQTVEFVKKCSFANLHVFPYSKRKGTPAANMKEQIPQDIKKHRANTLKEIAKGLTKSYLSNFIGKKLTVLWEHQDKNGLWCGHSQYNFIIKTTDNNCKKNTYSTVSIISVKDDFLLSVLDT